jgi:zinc protease
VVADVVGGKRFTVLNEAGRRRLDADRLVAAALGAAIVVLAAVAAADDSALLPARPPATVERYVLSNGLEVLLQPDHHTSKVALVVYYRAGRLSEPKGLAGLAHLVEHMAFRGSRHLTGEQLWMWPQRWGIREMNAMTSLEGTLYQMLVPSEQLPRALWFESERMAFTLEAMTAQHLELERAIIKNELSLRRGADHLLPYLIADISYPPGHAMRDMSARARDDLDALDLPAAQWFFQRVYRPDNATLALVGNFDSVLVKQSIERYFGAVRNPSMPRDESSAGSVQCWRRRSSAYLARLSPRLSSRTANAFWVMLSSCKRRRTRRSRRC